MVSGRIWASKTATVWWSRDSCDDDIVRAEDAEDGSFDYAYSDEGEKGDEVNLREEVVPWWRRNFKSQISKKPKKKWWKRDEDDDNAGWCGVGREIMEQEQEEKGLFLFFIF